MKQLRLFSTSIVYGSGYLDYCAEEVKRLFAGRERIYFLPYARPSGISHDDYFEKARSTFESFGLPLLALHHESNPAEALEKTDGIFTSGGNTFLLLKQVYEQGLLEPLKKGIEAGRIAYMGTSAGSVIAGATMHTTNDMPIVYPPSFDALGCVPFCINAHYLDPIPGLKHMGETRETRIKEYHTQSHIPVVGLREGGWVEVVGAAITLRGPHSARIFLPGKEAFELETNSSLKPALA